MAESFSAEERAAMKERAKELKAAKGKEANLDAALKAIAEMPAGDRAIAERVHAIVTEVAPDLEAKTWYGQPAWARDGTVICFFQSAAKFGTRYATLGFSEDANLDDGNLWPTSYGLAKLTKDDEATISALVKKATS